MTKKFDELYKFILREAQGDENLPDFGKPDQQPGQTQDAGSPEAPSGGLGDDLNAQLGDLDNSVPPEELELAKMAIRATNFNVNSKDIHQYKMKVNGQIIPFDEVSSYFEQTKNWQAVLKFVEWIINKYEGANSKWSEDQELLGKDIIKKIRFFNKDRSDPSKLLDNSKRIVWTRIILNALINPDPSFNINSSEVDDSNLPDIFNMLKQKFGNNSKGLFSTELKGPSNN
jgi:hypothetical protein